jgi:hypothetical protein
VLRVEAAYGCHGWRAGCWVIASGHEYNVIDSVCKVSMLGTLFLRSNRTRRGGREPAARV